MQLGLSKHAEGCGLFNHNCHRHPLQSTGGVTWMPPLLLLVVGQRDGVRGRVVALVEVGGPNLCDGQIREASDRDQATQNNANSEDPDEGQTQASQTNKVV